MARNRHKPLAHHTAVIERAQTQRTLRDRMIDDTVRQIHTAYAEAERNIAATVSAFVAAYRVEWQRVNEQLADEDGGVDAGQRAAHLRHWLIVSGWRNRLLAAYRQAAQDASQQSLAVTLAAQKPMVETGWNHARQLLVAAMQPAIEAGAPWRPKP